MTTLDLSVRKLFFYLLLAGLSSCAGTKITDLNYALMNIQRAVSNQMPGGVDWVSENKREFRSKPFRLPPQYFTKKELAHKGPPTKRGKASVWVLGDRRPYDIKVSVVIQAASYSGASTSPIYVDDHGDPELENQISQAIQDELAQRQRDRNLIDDFRPF